MLKKWEKSNSPEFAESSGSTYKSTVFHINYGDHVNSWKNLRKLWNSPLCRNKSGPFRQLNVAIYWKSS